MQFQRFTRHDGDALRFIVVGARGPLEWKVTAAWAALTHDGESEIGAGEEIAVLWRASGCQDPVIWERLEAVYDRFTALPVAVAPMPGPQWAAVRAAADWCDFVSGYGSDADQVAAEHAHMAALRSVLTADDQA